ncbi:MAG: flavodoxin domain-containing protein [Firmicutes bacterium]|nr:flavodoxin domain-containing protein [Bacillota bacterium]
MNYTIFYFSATGNSLQIARMVAKNLKNCIVRSMTLSIPEKSFGGIGEAIGFVFPVFYCGLPRLVERFITNLVILPNTYCFALINSGGSPANPSDMLLDILSEKNLCLAYSVEVVMPTNYIIGHQPLCENR